VKTLAGVRVVGTFMVPGPDRVTRSHYEVQVKHPAEEARTKPTALLTKDEDLYQRALDVEGTEQLVTVHWQPGTRESGQTCKVLNRLECV
jgi:D-hexose-6-phosphate mutarotase